MNNIKRLVFIFGTLMLILASSSIVLAFEEMQITSHAATQELPSIYENLVVYEDWRSGTADIYMYNISTGIETQITTNTADQKNPTIYGDIIVWADYRNNEYDIYMYNISSQTESPLCTASNSQNKPMIDGTKVVWRDERRGNPGNRDIYMYDLLTHNETPIVMNKDLRYAQISGDLVVWEDMRYSNYDIFMYNISSGVETRITTNTSSQEDPAVYGNKIVWQDTRNGSYKMFMYNISNGVEFQISFANDANQNRAAIYGDRVVWRDYRNNNWDVYMYDISEGTETQITNKTSTQWNADVYGNIIVWADNQNGGYDIYAMLLCVPNWVADNNACQINDEKLVSYSDMNNCGISYNLPSNDSTFVSCDYCTPSWAEVNNSCQPDNTITGWYNDTNGCYALTGLPSDDNSPANNTYPCSYNILNFALHQTRADSQLYGPFFRGISVLDVDNDNDFDFIFGGYDWNNAGSIIYENDGTGTYSIKQTLDDYSPYSTAGVPVGDIDNDGDIDLFSSNTNNGYVQYIYKNYDGGLNLSQTLTGIVYSGGGDFGDIDSDGDLDLIMSGAKITYTGLIYTNNGSGFFIFNNNISSNISEIDVTVGAYLADIDNDGDLDILTSPGDSAGNSKTPIGIFKNDGTGNFSLYYKLPYTPTPKYGLEINDFNGDNYMDIVVLHDPGISTILYLNDGNGIFTEYSNLADSSLTSVAGSSADIDNDGDNDLIIAYRGGKTKVYLNDGSGHFTSDFETAETSGWTQVRLVDVDNDGKLDFVLGAYNPGSALNVYKSTISSTNTQPSAPTIFNQSYSNGKLTLTWNSGSDAETPANLMMYNIKIGTSSGSQNIVSGVYGTPMKGNMQQRKSITLNIPNQDYYWSVQTIDSGLKASGWSTEQSHTAPLAIPEKIVFMSTRDGNYEIYTMNPDGSDQTRLTDNPASEMWPIWSPDRNRIAFQSNRDGNYEIYVMNANGSNQTRLTNNPSSDYNLAWSPYGNKITFHSQRDGNDEIYVINLDGTNTINLTNNPASDQYPDWSPDGSKIAFYSDRDGNDEIYVMNADGSGQTRLTDDSLIDANPSWSQDGSKIVFYSYRDGNAEIYTMNSDGTGQTRLTDNPAVDAHAHWATHNTTTAPPPNTPPTHTTPLLLSELGTDFTTEDLTCYPQNVDDIDEDPITTIFNWYVNNNPLTALNIPFDAQSNTTAKDYSGNSNDGAITGAVWTSQGKSGGALSFDGAGDYVEVGDTATFKWMHGADNPSDFNFTISLWMQLDNPEPGDTYSLVSTEGGSSHTIGVGAWFEDYPTQGSRKLRLSIFNGVSANYVVSYYSPDNVYPYDTGWHYVVFTYDHSLANDNVIIYVDGVEVSRGNKGAATPSTADSTYNLHIGSNGNVLDEFAGKIDDVKIYKKVLSAEQIYQDYIDSGKTNSTIVSQETNSGEEWKCSVMPNDGIGDGITLDSNSLVIYVPVIGNGTQDGNTTVIIDNSTDLTGDYQGTLDVLFKQADKIVAEFNYNFSEAPLNLTGISVEKEPASATKAYIILKGLELQNNNTKTLYMNRLNTNLNYVCIKDAEINDISEMSKNCKGSNEYIVPCNGNNFYSYTCTKTTKNYTITGLKHSAVKEVILGDINDDGNVTIADIDIMKQIIVGQAPSNVAADLDGDKVVSPGDYVKLMIMIMDRCRENHNLCIDPVTYYMDEDGDGYGTSINKSMYIRKVYSNIPPSGYSSSNTDCNDTNTWEFDIPEGFLINPGATEVCGDLIDNNCNKQIDEGC